MMKSALNSNNINWEETGLLIGLESYEKRIVILLFDLVMNKLGNIDGNIDDNIKIYMLAMMRRIYVANDIEIKSELRKIKNENEDKKFNIEKLNEFLNCNLIIEIAKTEYNFCKALVDDMFNHYVDFINNSTNKLKETPETIAYNINIELENIVIFCELFTNQLKKQWTT